MPIQLKVQHVLNKLQEAEIDLTPREISTTVQEAILHSEMGTVNEAYVDSIINVLKAGKQK